MADQSFIFGNTVGVKQPCALCLCSEGATRLAKPAGGVPEGRCVLRRGLWALEGGQTRKGEDRRQGEGQAEGGSGRGAPPSPCHTPPPPSPAWALTLPPGDTAAPVPTGHHLLLLLPYWPSFTHPSFLRPALWVLGVAGRGGAGCPIALVGDWFWAPGEAPPFPSESFCKWINALKAGALAAIL